MGYLREAYHVCELQAYAKDMIKGEASVGKQTAFPTEEYQMGGSLRSVMVKSPKHGACTVVCSGFRQTRFKYASEKHLTCLALEFPDL